MISQLFILAPNGHTIVHKDYRSEVPKDAAETFLRKVVEKKDTTPVFNVEGVNYICVRKNGLFFLCTTVHNVSPAYIIELLTQLTKVCKDYIGVLNEESLRKNFTLIYELVDEMIDFGYPQSAATADLQAFVFNEAAPVSTQTGVSRHLPMSFKQAPKTMSSRAVHKPIALRDSGRDAKNEIFVDVIDRISATFNASGQVRTFSIDGSIQMKSYLSGTPELHLALNDDLVINGGGGRGGGYGSVELDNVNFHECVQLDRFEQERMLVLEPPQGEFVLMNFHIGSLRHEGQIPFRVQPVVSPVSDYKQELRLQVRRLGNAIFKRNIEAQSSKRFLEAQSSKRNLRSNLERPDLTNLANRLRLVRTDGAVTAAPLSADRPPSAQVHAEFADKFHGANVKVQFTVPKSSTGASVELAPQAKGQSWEYDDASKTVTWHIRKFPGASVQFLSCKFVMNAGANARREMGPISMNFEIPMFNVSQLQAAAPPPPYQCTRTQARRKKSSPHRQHRRALCYAPTYAPNSTLKQSSATHQHVLQQSVLQTDVRSAEACAHSAACTHARPPRPPRTHTPRARPPRALLLLRPGRL